MKGMLKMSALDWLVILAYLAVMLYIGYHSMKTVKTDEDFVLAGRNVGNIYIILSLFASFTGLSGLFGTPQYVYEYGIAGWWWWATFPIGVFIMGMTMAKLLRRRMHVTLPDVVDVNHSSKAVRVAAYETDLKENCDNIARNLIGQAVSRCAADHCSETTVSVVPLPSDEMKGRIIGREGRNIRALETATGGDLIIDDTPEAITLSSFDQTRREVARMTLERLIGDGRIHPARIEETVEKCRHELELQMKREGERAVMELGIHGLHPDLIKLIGRLKYRTSFGQNALTHSMEVAWVAGLLAGEMGVNVTMARRAGLLHDIGKALDHEIEGSHVQIGVDICRKYKENTQIIHAIEAHHGDVEPKTPLAFIIQAADAISAARPGARRENVESYVKRLENLEEISSSFEGVEQAFAVQAGREVRIMVKPDVISDDQVILLARSIAKKIEDTLDYPGQIKVNVIRESRAVEYAK